jgi:hypothetical protein
MTPIVELNQKISFFKKLNKEAPAFPEVVIKKSKLTAADVYDIRLIGKQEAKKLPTRDIESLIEYGSSYIKEYETGRFMTRKDRYGMVLADFDEAEAYYEISRNIAMLTSVLQGRM